MAQLYASIYEIGRLTTEIYLYGFVSASKSNSAIQEMQAYQKTRTYIDRK